MKLAGRIRACLRWPARQANRRGRAPVTKPHHPPRETITALSALAPALLCGLPGSVAAQASVGPVNGAWVAVAGYVLAVIALGALAVLAVRVARSQAALLAQLRESRSRAACLEPLLDVWLWTSDDRHCLVSMRPPHGAAASDWAPVPDGTRLQDRYVGADPAALAGMLANAAALDDIAVHEQDASGESRSGLLRGRPYADTSGRFAGYLGTFRRTEAAPVPATPVPAPPPSPTASVTATTLAPAADHESFSFTVSHDLRAPIRVVEGFTKIVKEDYGRLLDKVGNDHLDRVLGAAARMNNMIDALLALSKLSSQPLAHQPVNLSQLAGYVADDLRRQWPDRSVHLEIQPDLQVQGDPTLLRVVIENLLGNAWKYTGKAGDARIAFTRHAQDPDTYTVSDNGAGFDMRFADRLFGVFQRLHSANDFPGTGIGLASVRRIVRRHGGEIWGEAEVNKGARFHFSLPQQPSA